MMKSIIRTAGAVLALTAIAVGGASAKPKLEKVDMVREGIDLKPIVVKANANGYTGYETSSHGYMLRVFAKGKGSSHVYWVGITNGKGAHPMEVGWSYFFDQRAAKGTEGWGVYKKSLTVHMGIGNTQWITSPKQACSNKLASEMAKGKSKSQVLKTELKTQTSAVIYFVAAADSKGNVKKRDHKIGKIAVGEKGVVYPVQVTCRKGL